MIGEKGRSGDMDKARLRFPRGADKGQNMGSVMACGCTEQNVASIQKLCDQYTERWKLLFDRSDLEPFARELEDRTRLSSEISKDLPGRRPDEGPSLSSARNCSFCFTISARTDVEAHFDIARQQVIDSADYVNFVRVRGIMFTHFQHLRRLSVLSLSRNLCMNSLVYIDPCSYETLHHNFASWS